MAIRIDNYFKNRDKKVATVNDFSGGLASNISNSLMKDSHFQELDNFDIKGGSTLEKRPGTVIWHQNSINTETQGFARVNDNLFFYLLDGVIYNNYGTQQDYYKYEITDTTKPTGDFDYSLPGKYTKLTPGGTYEPLEGDGFQSSIYEGVLYWKAGNRILMYPIDGAWETRQDPETGNTILYVDYITGQPKKVAEDAATWKVFIELHITQPDFNTYSVYGGNVLAPDPGQRVLRFMPSIEANLTPVGREVKGASTKGADSIFPSPYNPGAVETSYTMPLTAYYDVDHNSYAKILDENAGIAGKAYDMHFHENTGIGFADGTPLWTLNTTETVADPDTVTSTEVNQKLEYDINFPGINYYTRKDEDLAYLADSEINATFGAGGTERHDTLVGPQPWPKINEVLRNTEVVNKMDSFYQNILVKEDWSINIGKVWVVNNQWNSGNDGKWAVEWGLDIEGYEKVTSSIDWTQKTLKVPAGDYTDPELPTPFPSHVEIRGIDATQQDEFKLSLSPFYLYDNSANFKLDSIAKIKQLIGESNWPTWTPTEGPESPGEPSEFPTSDPNDPMYDSLMIKVSNFVQGESNINWVDLKNYLVKTVGPIFYMEHYWDGTSWLPADETHPPYWTFVSSTLAVELRTIDYDNATYDNMDYKIELSSGGDIKFSKMASVASYTDFTIPGFYSTPGPVPYVGETTVMYAVTSAPTFTEVSKETFYIWKNFYLRDIGELDDQGNPIWPEAPTDPALYLLGTNDEGKLQGLVKEAQFTSQEPQRLYLWATPKDQNTGGAWAPGVDGSWSDTAPYFPDGSECGTETTPLCPTYGDYITEVYDDLSPLFRETFYAEEDYKLDISKAKMYIHQGQLLLYYGNKIWVSKINDFGYIPMYQVYVLNDEIGDIEIQTIKNLQQALVIFTNHNIWTLSGHNPSDFRLDKINQNYGIVAPWSAVNVDNKVDFLSDEGIMELTNIASSGTDSKLNVKNITEPIKDRVNTGKTDAVGILWDNRYMITMEKEDGTPTLLMYHGEYKQWQQWSSEYFDIAYMYTHKGELYYVRKSRPEILKFGYTAEVQNEDGDWISSGIPGHQDRYNLTTHRGGALIESHFITKNFDIQLPLFQKAFKELQVMATSLGKHTKFQVKAYSNGEELIDTKDYILQEECNETTGVCTLKYYTIDNPLAIGEIEGVATWDSTMIWDASTWDSKGVLAKHRFYIRGKGETVQIELFHGNSGKPEDPDYIEVNDSPFRIDNIGFILRVKKAK